MNDSAAARVTAKQAARLAGVSTHTLRYYVRLGLVHPARDPLNKYHLYGPSELNVLRFIGHAKQLGFTLTEIALILGISRKGDSPCATVRQIAATRLAQFDEQLRQLQASRRHIRRALALWSRMPDSLPGGGQICALIESAGKMGAATGRPSP